MTPPQVQRSLQLLSTAGIPPFMTFRLPGTQGAAVTGTHGIGVRTPRAAAVAAATVGFAADVHAPNGGMFMTGAKSLLLAEGVLVMTRLSGSTTRVEGATPKLHIMVAPVATAMAMSPPLPERPPRWR